MLFCKRERGVLFCCPKWEKVGAALQVVLQRGWGRHGGLGGVVWGHSRCDSAFRCGSARAHPYRFVLEREQQERVRSRSERSELPVHALTMAVMHVSQAPSNRVASDCWWGRSSFWAGARKWPRETVSTIAWQSRRARMGRWASGP